MDFKDKNGNPIKVGDRVKIDGFMFDVDINLLLVKWSSMGIPGKCC